MNVKLKSFLTPNFVLQEVLARPRQEGFQECPKYPLSEVDLESLSDLCDQFRKEVFEKAGKQDLKPTH